MVRVEGLMSRFLPGSDVARLNATCCQPVAVHLETFSVVEQALRLSCLTGGAFDAAVSLGDGAGHRDVFLDREAGTISLQKPGMALDLGGIAKGYAVDRAIEVLLGAGMEDALVSAGGDIRVLGRGASGRSWSIGIQHPGAQEGLLWRLPLADGAIASSGNYYKRRPGHIQDPRRGGPAQDSLAATVVAGQALEADALATAAFVLGPDAGIDLLENLRHVEGLVVGRDRRIRVSSGLEALRHEGSAPSLADAHWRDKLLSRRRVLLGALGLVGTLAVGCRGREHSLQNPLPTPPIASITDEARKLVDGTFCGESLSGVLVRVEVTVQAGCIRDIQILEYREISSIHAGKPAVGEQEPWPDIRDDVLMVIPERIIEKQSVAVDGVTGATMSSQTIIAAVEDALSKAELHTTE
jgi:thiamine biosynthesis lipoprotein